jgi:hypothetical protein
MTAILQNFSMYQGDDVRLGVTLVDAAGLPVSLVGATLKWGIAKKAIDGVPLLLKTIGSGITVLDAVGGSFEVALTPSDTQSLVGDYYHEVELTDAASKRLTVLTGKVQIAPTLII